MADPAIKITPDAATFVQERGGSLWVWPTRHRCCAGDLVLLDAATVPPRVNRAFRQIAIEGGLSLHLDAPGYDQHSELQIELRGRRKKRIEAYWNGCAYVL